jgi:thioredoxin-dependent peroxiredoxin
MPGDRTNESVRMDGWVYLEKVEFKDSGITVVGIAPDAIAAVQTFATKHNVTVRELRNPPFTMTTDDECQYPMLSDASGEARKAYDVPRGMMGLTEGRVTFFIDSQGVVR